MVTSRIIKCPSCKRTTRYDATNEFRPFCSDRCKNADIAAWATESYKVSVPLTDEDLESISQDIQPKEDSDD